MNVILCTCPPDHAERLARHLLAGGAACVNVLSAVRSLYVWEGAVHDDTEALLVVKAARENVDSLRRSLTGVHPYTLPEWVVLPVDADLTGSDYRAWVRAARGTETADQRNS
jgi:periplasmic divalent cation tolerance protein